MFCSSRTDSLLSGSTASSVCFPAEHRSDWSDWSGWIQWSEQREHSAHSRSAPLHHCPESPPATNSQPHSAGNSLISSTHISTPTILFPTSFNKLFLKSNLFGLLLISLLLISFYPFLIQRHEAFSLHQNIF